MPKIFKIVDSHWTCINDPSIPCLADYLWSFGFDIPETIDYCLASNDRYRLKFRCYGGKIIIYIHPNN